MHITQIIQQMELNALRIRTLVEGVSAEQARWKPGPDSWSVLEVVNHLYDEEREDFRVRLDLILHQPKEEWPPIDPRGWVATRRYNQREIGPSLKAFLDERNSSIAWLKSLDSPSWQAAVQAPFGEIRAGDMVSAWAAHDLLHLRQLVELQHAFIVQITAPYSTEYAGPWETGG
ncbi:MAG TPA: DinB family protein [Anaerolineales bacterium]